jgi:hypothetical protein
LAFLDLSSLRTQFWPLPFPSENFGWHGKNFTGDRKRALAEATACQVTRMSLNFDEKGKVCYRRHACHYETKRMKRTVFCKQVRLESAFVFLQVREADLEVGFFLVSQGPKKLSASDRLTEKSTT